MGKNMDGKDEKQVQQEEIARLKATLISQEQTIAILKEIIEDALKGGNAASNKPDLAANERARIRLEQLTIKQVAAMLVVVNGETNKFLAERCDVTESTAKTYVGSLASRLGCNAKRGEIARVGRCLIDAAGDQFESITGLPVDWVTNYDPDSEANQRLRTKRL